MHRLTTNRTTNRTDHLSWMVLVVVALIIAFALHIGPQDWSQFKSDLLAALLAVAGGVPAGLWLNRMAERGRRIREEADRTRRRRVVLDGLLAELAQHERAYERILTHDETDAALIPLGDCQTHFWNALAASGTLELIDDARLLGRLSSTYYLAEMFNGWARAMRDIYMLNTPMNYRQELAARAWPHLVEAARKADGSRTEVVPFLQQGLSGEVGPR